MNKLYPQFRPFCLDDSGNLVYMELDRRHHGFQIVDKHQNNFPSEFLTQEEGKLRNILGIEGCVGEYYRQMRVCGQQDGAERPVEKVIRSCFRR